MDRISKLLLKASAKLRFQQRLEQDNPYLGKSFDELLDYMDGEDYRAPEMGTTEWDKFIYAMILQKEGS